MFEIRSKGIPFLTKSLKYKPVQSQDGFEDTKYLINSEEPLCESLHSRAAVRVQILFYLSTGILLLSVLLFVGAWSRTPGELECAKIVSPYCE